MPTLAESTIAAAGAIIQSQAQAAQASDSGSGTPGSLVPMRSTLPNSDVLATVTASALTPNGVPIQATWQAIAPSSSGSAVAAAATVAATSSPIAAVAGIPWQVTNVTASENVIKLSNNTLSALVSVAFLVSTGDPNYAFAQVWMTGYGGVSTPQLMASGPTSPIEFLASTTGETVTITVVAMGVSGNSADFSAAPSVNIVLDGVVTAPPAPTISQTTTALSGSAGWQFAWNVLSGLIADVISGYWVYVSATDDPTTATRYQYFAQPPSNIGVLTFQEFTSATHFYWVSAVNTTGLESTKTAAEGVTTTHSFYPTTVSGSYDSPGSAYDLNETTSSDGVATSPATLTETWSGFPTFIGTPSSVVLKVLNSMDDILTMEDGSNGSAPPVSIGNVLYSIDGGTTWSYLASSLAGGISKGYSEVALSTSQNLALVQVSSSVITYDPRKYPTDGSDPASRTATMSVYEIRIEVTQ